MYYNEVHLLGMMKKKGELRVSSGGHPVVHIGLSMSFLSDTGKAGEKTVVRSWIPVSFYGGKAYRVAKIPAGAGLFVVGRVWVPFVEKHLPGQSPLKGSYGMRMMILGMKVTVVRFPSGEAGNAKSWRPGSKGGVAPAPDARPGDSFGPSSNDVLFAHEEQRDEQRLLETGPPKSGFGVGGPARGPDDLDAGQDHDLG